MLTRRELLAALTALTAHAAQDGPSHLPPSPDAGAYTVRVNAANTAGPCDPSMWANIGYDPMWAVTVDPATQPFWQSVHATRALRYIRCHNTFSDAAPGKRPDRAFGCRVFREANGGAIYDWRYLDEVLDTWVSAGLKPILETSYMPDALAERPIERNYGGGAINAPRDYRMWRNLVYEFVRHLLERYGANEVRTWYFEVWNEPDLRTYFVDGRDPRRPAEPFRPGQAARFCRMYDWFVDGATAADDAIRVGGPGLAGWRDFLTEFLDHISTGRNDVTGQTGTRIDFISWHGYGTTERLRATNRAMKGLIRSQFPSLSSVEQHMNEWGQDLGSNLALSDRPSCHTEYEAAFLCRLLDLTLNDASARVSRLLRWGQPVSGWRNVAREYDGTVVAAPILNAYELLARMEGDWVESLGTGAGKRAGAMASRSAGGRVNVLVYHFDEQHEQGGGPPLPVRVLIEGLPKSRYTALTHYRIDRDHANAYHLWDAMGRPARPNAAQVRRLADAAKLKPLPGPQRVHSLGGKAQHEFPLPVNAVSLLTLGSNDS